MFSGIINKNADNEIIKFNSKHELESNQYIYINLKRWL